MRCIVKYNPDKDIMAVEQFGFVDLAKANASGIVDTPLDSDQTYYNEIDDPRSIAGRPSDVFDAMQADVVISGYSNTEDDKSE